MIDRADFANAWKHLCGRFRRRNDPAQAAAYYDFLADQMDTAEFLQAARALWATARYFPRPADFVLVAGAAEWPTVLRAVAEYTPPHGQWHQHWRELSPRAVEACRRLGGIEGMRAAYERDVLRLKTEWERAFEQATADAVLALPAPGAPRIGAGA